VGLIFAGAASIMIGQLMLMKTRFVAAFEAAKEFVSFVRSKMTVELAKSIAVFAAAAGAIGLVAYGINQLTQQIGRSKFGDFASDVDGVRRALEELGRSGKFTGVLAEIDALAGAKADLDALNEGLDSIQNNDWWKFGFDMDWGSWGQGVRAGAEVAAENLKVIDEQLTALYQTSVTDASAAFEILKQRLLDAGWSMKDIENALPGFTTAQQAGKEATGEWNEETRLLVEALDEQKNALEKLFNPIFAAIDASDSLRDAQNRAKDAAWGVFGAQAAYDQAVKDFGKNSPKALEALGNLEKAQRDLEKADLDNIKAAQKLDSAYLELAKQAAESGDTTAAFEAKLKGWVDQGLITEAQAAKVRDKYHEVKAAAEQVPADTPANLSTNADEVAAKIRAIKDALKGLTRADLNNGAERLVFGPFMDRFTGGPVTARTPYLVGERGPELFVPNGSGSVVPDHRTRTALGTPTAAGPASGATYNITINGLVGRDKRDILDFLARELPKAAATHERSYA
jgi:hypothetical protein